jgi:NitT/TauT family transport system ATP-binding protein
MSAVAPPNLKIRICDLGRRFPSAGTGGFFALKNISIDIEDRAFFMIVGPSGCGKTTLLRILANLDHATSGTVDVAVGDQNAPANSMVFQGESIFPWLTVWDNAAYGLRIRGVARSEVKDRVSFFLDRCGIMHFKDHYPHQLSGGTKQRVSIARAFANDPEILLMDEPFSALDEQNKTLLQEELLRIWDENRKTVLFITHSVDEAITLGDKIMVMTASPGSIKAVIDVPFERPRHVIDLRSRPEYGYMVANIWGHLREEVTRAARNRHELTV